MAHIRLCRIEWRESLQEVNQSTCMWKEAEDRRCTYKFNIKVCWRNHCCGVKTVSITYSECVFVAIVSQHIKGMRRVTLSFVSCLALQYLPHDLINGTIFVKRLPNIKYVYWFSPQRLSKAVFLNRRAAARYRALASIIAGRERFSWNLSF